MGVGDVVCPRHMKLLSLEASGTIRNRTKGWSRWSRSSQLWCFPIQDVISPSSEAMVVPKEMAFAYIYLLPGLPLCRICSSCWWNHKGSSDSGHIPPLGWRCMVSLLFMTLFLLKDSKFQWSFSLTYRMSPPATYTGLSSLGDRISFPTIEESHLI